MTFDYSLSISQETFFEHKVDNIINIKLYSLHFVFHTLTQFDETSMNIMN